MSLPFLSALATLAMLTLLQAVLGFDNLLYITIESRRVPAERQRFVRRAGIAVAMVARIGLLLLLLHLVQALRDPFLRVDVADVLHAAPSGHALIVLAGGAFILYTATREILRAIQVGPPDAEHAGPTRSARSAVAWIVAMNVVFSFDSILSAMALTDSFAIMALAIVAGSLLMIGLSERVAAFLERNRAYEVLGLFVLFVVGVMLVTEGGHLARVEILGRAVTPMSRTTFYFVVTVLVLTDVVQSRYQRRLRGDGRAAPRPGRDASSPQAGPA